MFVTKKALPRRTFLRAMGATVALPMLDAMVPALGRRAQADRRASASSTSPTASSRTSGFRRRTGAGFELTPILQPFANVREPDQRAQRALAPAGRHLRRRHRRSSARVGGVAHRRPCLRPHAAGRRSAAGDDGRPDDRQRGRARRRGCPRSSWRWTSRRRARATPATASTSTRCRGGTRRRRTPPNRIPRVVFERLFGDGGSAEARQARMRSQGSILDSLRAEVSRVNADLGARRPGEAGRVSRFGARGRAAHPELRVAAARRRAARAAARHPRALRRAHAS